jgi:hypothetical protein
LELCLQVAAAQHVSAFLFLVRLNRSQFSNLTFRFKKKRFFVMANTAELNFCDAQHCEVRLMHLL